jgi:hypothetical protein
MQVRAFFPCEQIVSRMDQSIDIMRFGPHNINIAAKKGQTAQVQIGIVCVIAFSAVEKGDKHLSLSLMSPDGPAQELISVNFNVSGQKGTEEFDIHSQAALLIKEQGKHILTATLGGQEIASWPIEVIINYIEEN